VPCGRWDGLDLTVVDDRIRQGKDKRPRYPFDVLVPRLRTCSWVYEWRRRVARWQHKPGYAVG
jgi:hypothetical protein